MNEYKLIDEKVVSIAKKIRPVYYITPINSDDVRKRFLLRKIDDPLPYFIYRKLEYDPIEIEKELKNIKVPDTKLGILYKNKIKELLLENKIIMNIGNKDVIRYSVELYGKPDKELISLSNKIIKNKSIIKIKKEISADEVKEVLEKYLRMYNLKKWRIEFSDKYLTTTMLADKKISVCRNRKFTKNDPRRLGIHEIGVHVLRFVNGDEQKLKIFSIGLAGYLTTEEGIASYFEEIEKVRDVRSVNYALNVICVENLCKGLSFKQTFDKLKEYGFSDDKAWNRVLKVFRGGGFVKDYIYLKGLLRIREFVKKNKDFNDLYVGKIGIDDLELIESLLKEGVIEKPKYLPINILKEKIVSFKNPK